MKEIISWYTSITCLLWFFGDYSLIEASAWPALVYVQIKKVLK